jgi:hypothetical protein
MTASVREHDQVARAERDLLLSDPHHAGAAFHEVVVREVACRELDGPGRRQLRAAEQTPAQPQRDEDTAQHIGTTVVNQHGHDVHLDFLR